MKNLELISIRKDRGLTQAQVASRSNITVRGYQYFENGQLPNVKIALRIADVLGVSDLRILWKY